MSKLQNHAKYRVACENLLLEVKKVKEMEKELARLKKELGISDKDDAEIKMYVEEESKNGQI